jgi:hypothetical protein
MCKNRKDEKTLTALERPHPIPVGLAAYSHNYFARPQLRTIYLHAETGSQPAPRRTPVRALEQPVAGGSR